MGAVRRGKDHPAADPVGSGKARQRRTDGNGRPLERRFSGGPPVRGTGRLGKSPVCAGDGLRGSESGGHAHGAGPDLGDGQAGARVVRRHEAPLGFGPGAAGSIRRRGAGRAVHRAG